jgi:hypothetical protein
MTFAPLSTLEEVLKIALPSVAREPGRVSSVAEIARSPDH